MKSCIQLRRAAYAAWMVTCVVSAFAREPATAPGPFRVTVGVQRGGHSMLDAPVGFDAEPGKPVTIDALKAVRAGDTMTATLEAGEAGSWRAVGTPVQREIGRGAPFTIGRTMGLGKEPVEFGGTFQVDGVAILNCVLGDEELRALSFAGGDAERRCRHQRTRRASRGMVVSRKIRETSQMRACPPSAAVIEFPLERMPEWCKRMR